MNSENRYVFDANVIVSALLFNDSVPGQAFFRALDRGDVLMSPELAETLREVLSRKKFDRYLTRAERERLLVAVIGDTQLIHPSTAILACRDPHDDAILELAVAGRASFVVTGDQDLLVLDPFRGVRIVTPARLLELMAEEADRRET